MTQGEKYQVFMSSMANRGFAMTPLDFKQWQFLSESCQLPTYYIEGLALDVASGVGVMDAVFSAIASWKVDIKELESFPS